MNCLNTLLPNVYRADSTKGELCADGMAANTRRISANQWDDLVLLTQIQNTKHLTQFHHQRT